MVKDTRSAPLASPDLSKPVGTLAEADRALLLVAQQALEKVTAVARGALDKIHAGSTELSRIELESQRFKKMLEEAVGRDQWTFDEDRRQVGYLAVTVLLGKLNKVRHDQVAMTIEPSDTDAVIGHAKELGKAILGAPLPAEPQQVDVFEVDDD